MCVWTNIGFYSRVEWRCSSWDNDQEKRESIMESLSNTVFFSEIDDSYILMCPHLKIFLIVHSINLNAPLHAFGTPLLCMRLARVRK